MSEHKGGGAPRAQDPRDLIPAYLAGELSDDEARALEARIDEDAELEREVRTWAETMADLAEASAPPIEPSARAREALLERVAASAHGSRERASSVPATSRRSQRRREGPWSAEANGGSGWQRLALAAGLTALVVALGATWLQVSARARIDALQAERVALEARVGALESSEQRARRRVDELAAAVRGMVDPGRQPVVLASLPDQPDASGAAFYRGGGAVFYAFDLPALTAAQTYQLWYIGEDGPVSAGVFEVDALGEATVTVASVPPAETIAVWAVTIEPAGGVPQPTGPMVIKS